MKKLNINCNFGASTSMVPIFIGKPEDGHHPIHFQAEWLSKERGGTVSKEVMESLSEIKRISDENGIPFDELCEFALKEAGKSLADTTGFVEDRKKDESNSEG